MIPERGVRVSGRIEVPVPYPVQLRGRRQRQERFPWFALVCGIVLIVVLVRYHGQNALEMVRSYHRDDSSEPRPVSPPASPLRLHAPPATPAKSPKVIVPSRQAASDPTVRV